MKPAGRVEPAAAPAPQGARFESRSKLYAFPMPAARDGMGIIAVNAEPPAGEVLVNGVSYGAPPCELLVPAGVYDVRVTQGGRTMPRSVNVYAGTRELFFAVFEER